MTISEDTMEIYQRAWHYLGLWALPSKPRPEWYTAYSIAFNFCTLIVYNGCLFFSIFESDSFDILIETLLVAACSVTITIKVFLLLSCRSDISRLLELMKLLEITYITTPHERSILLDAKRKSGIATTFFICSKFVCLWC